ncbi:MAG: hypothetical protein KME49_22740 [Brasilonema octagenarum HA4186-MV1]|jgi:hypothetical protein|nr:hypothetical protein [Brasilonema octagenarum HA4186-MV1]
MNNQDKDYNFYDPEFWISAGIYPIEIDLNNDESVEQGMNELTQKISDVVKEINEENPNIKTFDVIMTSTEYDHFDDLCSDLAGNHVIDFNSLIHSHLVPQVNPEDVPEDVNAVNFHIEVVDDFTEEVFLEFDTNLTK